MTKLPMLLFLILFLVVFAVIVGLKLRNRSVPEQTASFEALGTEHVDASNRRIPLFGAGGKGKMPTKRFNDPHRKIVEEHYAVAVEIDGEPRIVQIPPEKIALLEDGSFTIRFKHHRDGTVEVLEFLE